MNHFRDASVGASICALVFLAPWVGTAEAASPAYCALYAREYTAQFATGSTADAAMASEYRILDQAYYQCLNMDVEPEFPDTSVYFGETPADVLGGGIGGPYEGIAQGDASAGDETAPAAAAPVKPKPTRTASASRRSGRGSGLELWSPEWGAWCTAHFPNSFDPKDGTVKPYGQVRRLCK